MKSYFAVHLVSVRTHTHSIIVIADQELVLPLPWVKTCPNDFAGVAINVVGKIDIFTSMVRGMKSIMETWLMYQ